MPLWNLKSRRLRSVFRLWSWQPTTLNLSVLLLCIHENRRRFESQNGSHMALFSAPMWSCGQRRRTRHNANSLAYMRKCPAVRFALLLTSPTICCHYHHTSKINSNCFLVINSPHLSRMASHTLGCCWYTKTLNHSSQVPLSFTVVYAPRSIQSLILSSFFPLNLPLLIPITVLWSSTLAFYHTKRSTFPFYSFFSLCGQTMTVSVLSPMLQVSLLVQFVRSYCS